MQPVTTHLSLDQFARIMGVPPLHFWGVNIDSMQTASVCSSAWFQHPWQGGGKVSRDDVAYAIAEAERDIEQQVGYRLLPSWEEDEWNPTIRPYRPEMTNLNSRDVRGRSQIVFAKQGHLLSGGIRSVTTIAEDAGVSYANDGMLPTTWLNRATVTVGISGDEISDDEVAVYYPGHGGDDRWRIRPCEVSHVADQYTIHFQREMALVPSYFDSYEGLGLRAAAGTDDANFLATVDVCRVFNDPQQQATLLWEEGGCSCPSGSCAYGTQTACLMLRDDPRLSIVVYNPAEWNPDTLAFEGRPMVACRQPDLVRLWYYAGWRDRNADHPLLELDSQWARIVAYFAASKLDRPACACTSDQFNQWQADLAFSGGIDETGTYSLSASDLASPFGTRRGALQAWRHVKQPGVVVGRGVLA